MHYRIGNIRETRFGKPTTFICILLLYGGMQVTTATSDVPRLPQYMLNHTGDLIIGGIAPVSVFASDGYCGETIDRLGLQNAYSTVYAIERVNADPLLLANVKLGWRIADSCYKGITAMAQALQFIPSDKAGDGKLNLFFPIFCNSKNHLQSLYGSIA